MPLLDHCHPPLSAERRWESFHSSWATKLADSLTERWLPPNYIAEEHAHLGPSVEIDVATFAQEASASGEAAGGTVATVGPKVWAPPAADGVLPAALAAGAVPDPAHVVSRTAGRSGHSRGFRGGLRRGLPPQATYRLMNGRKRATVELTERGSVEIWDVTEREIARNPLDTSPRGTK